VVEVVGTPSVAIAEGPARKDARELQQEAAEQQINVLRDPCLGGAGVRVLRRTRDPVRAQSAQGPQASGGEEYSRVFACRASRRRHLGERRARRQRQERKIAGEA